MILVVAGLFSFFLGAGMAGRLVPSVVAGLLGFRETEAWLSDHVMSADRSVRGLEWFIWLFVEVPVGIVLAVAGAALIRGGLS